MNREIKFRAWNDNVMRDWDYLCQEDGAGLDWWIRAGFPVMQYTGRKDSKGREAYEGDIYHCGYEYKDGTHKYGDRNVIEDIRTFAPEDEFTIIGNIYENPELLKS